MKNRQSYLQQLIAFRDKMPVKVITGVRRSGKSSLLELFAQYLLEDGVPQTAIINMNFESLTYDHLKDYRQLHDEISKRLQPNRMNYILLDEIQQIPEWERAINSLLLLSYTDIYITGSNAWLLSSELSTLLSGRYVEVKMLPLSFKEFLDFHEYEMSGDLTTQFNRFLEYGGFPGITEFRDNPSAIMPLLEGIYHTIVVKDVVQRNAIRDVQLLESLIRYLSGNISRTVSTRSIGGYLTSAGRKTTGDTIDNYLTMLEAAFIFYRAERYDVKGKLRLKTLEKYYIVDTGIRNMLIGIRNDDYGYTLENVVYLELLRRGYEVYVGKIGNLEVDFIATNPKSMVYYQVTASMADQGVRDRELAPLKEIPDNYEKIVLSMDRTPITDYSGIRNVNLIDFLLEDWE